MNSLKNDIYDFCPGPFHNSTINFELLIKNPISLTDHELWAIELLSNSNPPAAQDKHLQPTPLSPVKNIFILFFWNFIYFINI